MAKPRVLLTGFGPFPGVPENPSGWLAETIAARTHLPDWEVHGTVLPTEWNAIEALTPRLHSELQPHVMIHFGASTRAKGLRIERSAHNRTEHRADACGASPSNSCIAPNGATRLDTRLPTTALAAHLRAQGYAARVSDTCGRYLCNNLYYRSLQCAHARDRDALFVHIPLTCAQGGKLDQDVLLQAGECILRYVLDAVKPTWPTSHMIAPDVEARQ